MNNPAHLKLTNTRTKVSIAIIPAHGLGDAILFLIIANNLQKNDYQISFYNNHISQLHDWLPKIIAKQRPNSKNIKKIFSQHDLIIADSAIINIFPPSQYHDLARYCVFLIYLLRLIVI